MKTAKRYIITVIVLSTSLIRMSGSEISAADSAYLAGDYRTAAEIYNRVIEEQGTTAALLYNMGNAYVQLDDYGKAMLCYQRAKKLDPSNKLIASNIAYVQEKVADGNKAQQKGSKKKVEEDTPNFFQGVHTTIAENHSSNLWAGWACTFFLLFSGCGALYLFSSNVLLRKVGFFGGFSFLGLCMIFLVCAYSSAQAAESHDYGVVMAYKADLQTEPREAGEETENEGTLTWGTKVRIISEETDAEGNVTWYKVRLNSDYIGWLPSADVEVI